MSTTDAVTTDSPEQDAPVNGAAAAAGAPTFTVENPATGEQIAELPDLGPEQIEALAARGRAVQPAWEALGFEGRGRVLKRMQKWLMDHQDEVIEVIRSETGKTYEDALIAEVSYGGAAFGFWADHAPVYLAEETVKSEAVLVKGKKLKVRYKPLGLIGVIGPWNYPLTNSFGDCIPALAAGNSVILKPSEVTPLTSLKLAEGLKQCGIPEGVFQIATGTGQAGAALVKNVDMIMFTGSTRTGKLVMREAAEALIPVSLELGSCTTRCSTVDRPASRSNASTSKHRFTTGSSTSSPRRRASSATDSAQPGLPTSAR